METKDFGEFLCAETANNPALADAVENEREHIREVQAIAAERDALSRKLAVLKRMAKVDADDLKKMRDGTKLTRAGLVMVIGYLQDDVTELTARAAALEKEREPLRRALAQWNERYDEELQEADKEAEHWKGDGDMYGWNFHKGRRSGLVAFNWALYPIEKALRSIEAPTPKP